MKRQHLVLFAALAIATYGCGDDETTSGIAGAGGNGGTAGTGGNGGTAGNGGSPSCIPENDDVSFVVPQNTLTETPALCFERLGPGFGGAAYSLFPASPCPTGVVYLEWGSDDDGPLVVAGEWVAPNSDSVQVQILSTTAGVIEGTSTIRELPPQSEVTISTCELDAMTFRIDPNSLTITAVTPH